MMLQQPQLPTGEYQEKESDRLKLSPSYGLLPRGEQTAIDRELPARYPFLGSDDEQMVPTKKAEGCKRKPENERGGKRSKRDEVNGFAPKMESPPMSSITSAGSDASEGKYPSAALPEKRDYIHVRARRGQATDSHSLAERVRREKINQRMKVLQDLVPGCSKISGKAGMLDEIINYVQSLQRQVEFLSMKLAAVSPTIHFGNVDALFGKQIASVSGVEGVTTMPPEAADAPTPLVRFVPMHQAAAKAALPDELDPPASSAALFSESWPLLEMNPTAYPWEVDLQVLYGVEQRLEKEGPPLPAASPAAAPLLQPSFQWQFGCKG